MEPEFRMSKFLSRRTKGFLQGNLYNFTHHIQKSFLYFIFCVFQVTECRPCTAHERKIFPETCRTSGNLEKVKCGTTTTGDGLILSCPIAYTHEYNRFWVFEGTVMAVAVVANMAVWWRRRTLDLRFYQRIKRQISDSGL